MSPAQLGRRVRWETECSFDGKLCQKYDNLCYKVTVENGDVRHSVHSAISSVK